MYDRIKKNRKWALDVESGSYMKLVSPKALLASLLGIVFVIAKAMTFDGIADLLWMVAFGYFTIKGLTIAFSQRAYDEDMKEAYRRKVLYRDLFGKFAYIAADIPVIAILLASLLASLFPVTAILRVVLCALIIFAVGYAIWMNRYISKYKQSHMERGVWDTAELTAEEAQAWRRSELWHNISFGIIILLGVVYLIIGSPQIYMNNAKLE